VWPQFRDIVTPHRHEQESYTFCNFLTTLDQLQTCVATTVFGRRLGGVVVSVLATGPKGRRFEPGQGDGFLRAIKIRSTPSFG
jgi:hypothetical protein